MVGLRLVSPGNSPHLPAMSDTLKTRLHRKALTWTVALIAGAAAMVLALPVLLFPALERVYLNQLGSREASTLGLAVEGLNGSLRRFEALPGLIAERPNLARALRDPSDTALIDRGNADLRRTAEEVGLSDIFLIDPDGLTMTLAGD